jgi:hypothetical protein
MAEMTKAKAIKTYFGTEAHPVTLAELKALTPAERTELGEGAAGEMGVTIVAAGKASK